jgi:hypothetical protein
MHLLFCSNGIVLGTHDDTQTIDPAAYGEGVRVIPWDQPLSNLERVGPPPENLPGGARGDPRPYAQPVETPDVLKLYAAQQRFAFHTGGLVYNDIPINTDNRSQLHVSTLAQYAATLNKNDPIKFTQDSVAYSITAQDAINISNQMSAIVQQARTIEADCYAAIDAGTVTTYDQVDSAFAVAKRTARVISP